jgi:hypothetical protein
VSKDNLFKKWGGLKMKKIVTVASILALSSTCYAGHNMYLHIQNSSKANLALTSTGSSGLGSWPFWQLTNIAPNTGSTVWIEFANWRWRDQSWGDATYATVCPNGNTDTFTISARKTESGPQLSVKQMGFNCIKVSPEDGNIGWSEGGTRDLTINSLVAVKK